jgi:hypothetical protein
MSAFGEATGHVFLLAVPATLLTVVVVTLVREVRLRTTVHHADELPAGGELAAVVE